MARHKAAVVATVSRGEITQEEACCSYELSEDEYRSWHYAFVIYGIDGLRATLGWLDRNEQVARSPLRRKYLRKDSK